MKTETLFKLSNKIFGFLLLLLLLYEFNYSYGWGLNSMFPNIYFLKNEIGHKGFIFFIWSENGLIESLQVVTLLLTLYVLIKLTNNKIKKDNLIKIFLILKILGIIYIIFEEISWGQHFLNFESPKIFLDKQSFFYNKQEEFNLHNISNLFNEWPRALILAWCSLSIPLIKFLNFTKSSEIRLVIEPNNKLIILSYTIFLVSISNLLIHKLNLLTGPMYSFDNEGYLLNNGFKYDLSKIFLSLISFNFIRFSELQELLFFYYFFWHSSFLTDALKRRN